MNPNDVRRYPAVFPHYAWNGMNFNKSVQDPNSSLIRVLTYLSTFKSPVTKKKIMVDVFKKEIAEHPNFDHYPKVWVSGWRSGFFSLMLKNNLITMKRMSKLTVYSITPLGQRLVDCHRKDSD